MFLIQFSGIYSNLPEIYEITLFPSLIEEHVVFICLFVCLFKNSSNEGRTPLQFSRALKTLKKVSHGIISNLLLYILRDE